MSEELHMSVSQVFKQDGKKYAFVSFTDGVRVAEGKIPDCKIHSNDGFGAEEVILLEIYMNRELATLKKMASGVHIVDAFMKR